jgi:copper homeostasis protein (lipoprotein)
MKSWATLALVCVSVVVLDGCSSGCCNVSADVPPIGYDLSQRVSLDFPATYSGVLPCADCEGIRYTVNFWSDQVFFRRMTYLGKGEGEGASVDDVGRWNFTEDAQSLVLNTKDETPDIFTIEGRDVLKKLDMAGQPIESALNYTITRHEKVVWFEPQIRMHGMYTYMADAGRFTECLSRLSLPVAHEADNAEMERQYSFARNPPGEAVLVSVEGRIVNRPKMDGTGKEQVLVVDKFLNLWAGETCSPEVKVAAKSCVRY